MGICEFNLIRCTIDVDPHFIELDPIIKVFHMLNWLCHKEVCEEIRIELQSTSTQIRNFNINC